jgi:hypothetical protein
MIEYIDIIAKDWHKICAKWWQVSSLGLFFLFGAPMVVVVAAAALIVEGL